MRNSAVKSLLATAALTAAMMGGEVALVAAPALAASSSCSTRVEHSYSRTASGTQSWTYLTKTTCGHDYTEYEHRVTQSYTGAHSIEDLWKTMSPYPHWHSTEHLQSWTKRGTYSNKWIYRAG